MLATLASLPQADRRLLFPDIANPDMGQWADDCAAYAFERVCGYAAAACFLGKVAGVVGSDEEIEQARAIIKSAFAEIGNILYGGSDDIRALRAEQQQLDEAIYHHSHVGGMLGPAVTDRTPEAMKAFHHAHKTAMKTGDLSSIDELRQITRETLFGVETRVFNDGYIDNLKQEIVARRRLNEVQHKRRLLGDRDVGDVVVDYFKGVWDSIKKIYNELVENIESGRWKYGLCKASIDGGLLIFEEGLTLAVTAAFAAVGLAGLGVIMRIATIVVVDGVKVARRLSEVRHIHVHLTFTRQPVKGQFDVRGKQMIARDTKVKPHELNDTHKKFFDEDYQGNFTGNPPPAKPKEAKPAAPKALEPAALRQKLGLKNITDKEIILAGQAGKSAAHQEARERLVKSFAEATGVPAGQLKNMIDLEKGGIDLKMPLEIKEFKKGDFLTQWVSEKNGRPGNWVDPKGNQHPSSLGISPEGRVQQMFKMEKDGFAIESVAKKVVDDWTNPARPYQTKGKGTQWFIPDIYKPTPEEFFGRPSKTWREIPFEIP